MNLDLSPLIAWLNTQGPMGMVLGAAVMFLGPKVWAWLMAKRAPAPQPNAPAAPAAPAKPETPAADPLADRPFVSLGLALLQQWFAKQHPKADSEALLVGHLLAPLAAQVIVPPTAATPMTGPRLADRVPTA